MFNGKFARRLLASTIAIACIALNSNTTWADALINPSFETGDFSGWQTVGLASVVTSSFGAAASDGTYMALLNNDYYAGAPYPDAVGTFFGTTSTGFYWSGSAMKTSVEVQAGDILSFDWRMLTNEYHSVGGPYADYAYLFVNTQPTIFFSTGSINQAQYHPSVTGFYDETDIKTTNYTFSTPGVFTVGMAVVNSFDNQAKSGLLIDNLRITPAPEPSSMGILLIPVIFSFRRHRRKVSTRWIA